MAQLDKFIEAAFARGGDRLLIAAGEKALFFKDGSPHSMTSQPASASQARSILMAVLPAGQAARLEAGSGIEWLHDSPAGPVCLRVSHGSSGLRCEITRAVGAEERTSAAPPSREAAMQAAAASRSEGTGAGRGGVAVAEPPAATGVLERLGEAGSETLPAAPAGPGVPPAPAADAGGPAETASPGTGADPAASPSGSRSRMEEFLRRLVTDGCSDLHLCSGNVPYFRKDGDIVPMAGAETFSAGQVRDLLLSIAPRKYRERLEETGDTDFAHDIPGLSRFRCNLFMDRLGPGGVFRVIPEKIPSAEDLGLPEAVVDLCSLSKGLVLVTGPTGSGKSTTLAAMLDVINTSRAAHIITIEDPIEFVHPNKRSLVNQREVGVHTEGFKTALRAALREDPEIVLVGELRDLETVSIAIETAETGHLVFGTLHTNTAASTVDRMIDQFPSDRQGQVRAMLSESLKGVISQTLCKRKGGGRVAALEILLVTSAVSNLIREGKTFQIPSLMQTGKGMGMMLMNDALLDLVKEGRVEPEEALGKAVAKTDLRNAMSRAGITLG